MQTNRKKRSRKLFLISISELRRKEKRRNFCEFSFIKNHRKDEKVNDLALRWTINQFTFSSFSVILPFPRRLVGWWHVANSWHYCCFLSFFCATRERSESNFPRSARVSLNKSDDNFPLLAQQWVAEEEEKQFFSEQPVGKIVFLRCCALSETPQALSYCVFSSTFCTKKGFSARYWMFTDLFSPFM